MTIQVNGTTVIDASGNVILGSGPSDPVSPVAGQIWFNTTSGTVKGYNGTSWVTLTTA